MILEAPHTSISVNGVVTANQFRLNAAGGGSFQPGILYTDNNWGMMIRGVGGEGAYEFMFMNAGGDERMRMGDYGMRVMGTYSESDDRCKHSEESVTDALGSIKILKLKKYDKTTVMLEPDFNCDLGILEHHVEAGFIAQEVLDIPEFAFCVTGGGTGISPTKEVVDVKYSVNYIGLTNDAIQAIQELSKKVDELKADVEVLKAK